MVTNGSGSGLKFFIIILFQRATTSEMKYNCFSMVTNGSGSGLKLFIIILF